MCPYVHRLTLALEFKKVGVRGGSRRLCSNKRTAARAAVASTGAGAEGGTQKQQSSFNMYQDMSCSGRE
jgi:hypothetical protein